MRRLARGFSKYVFYPVVRAFAVYGQCFAPMGPYPQLGAMAVTEHLYPAPPPEALWSERTLTGLPVGHPERLRPDIRLSEFEREVLRQMDVAAPVD